MLKGYHSQGDTFEETIENVTESMELYIESLIADKQPIPIENLNYSKNKEIASFHQLYPNFS